MIPTQGQITVEGGMASGPPLPRPCMFSLASGPRCFVASGWSAAQSAAWAWACERQHTRHTQHPRPVTRTQWPP